MFYFFTLVFFWSVLILLISILVLVIIKEIYPDKGYKVFLDDLRTVDMVYDKSMEDEFIVVRNVADFKKLVQKMGVPDFVSFDHDLGEDEFGNVAETVYDAVKWMVYVKEYDLRKMDFFIHSSNPVGSENIEYLIKNWNKELDRRDGK